MREFEECLVFAENGLRVQGMEGERGMSEQRLIDANALVQRIYNAGLWDDSMEAAIRWIDSAPTVPAVVLPCSVDSAVYCIERGKIYECRVRSFIVGSNGVQGASIIGDDYTPTYRLADRFGSTVFITREEAEAALLGTEECT